MPNENTIDKNEITNAEKALKKKMPPVKGIGDNKKINIAKLNRLAKSIRERESVASNAKLCR